MEVMLGAPRKPPIGFQSFFEEYRQKVLNVKNKLKDTELVKESCSLQLLEVPHEPKSIIFQPGYTEMFRMPIKDVVHDPNMKLKTYENINTWKDSCKSNPFTRSRMSYKLVADPPVSSPTTSYEDLQITVRVYKPTRATHIGQTLEKPIFAEEFQCLGSNYLTELRDKISCICNGKQFFDISDSTSTEFNEPHTNPGYFFIHDTFYNDKRISENPDYSITVREWAKKASGLTEVNLKVADMAKTRFFDLTASLGFPQQYLHHGNCEHIFVFSQLEYLPKSSPKAAMRPSKTQYPYLSSYNIYKNKTCHMCGIRKYCFIVEQSKRQLYDPSFLCRTCFQSFHYIDGKKIGHFKAYKIFDVDDEKSNNEASDGDETSLYSESDEIDVNIKTELEN